MTPGTPPARAWLAAALIALASARAVVAETAVLALSRAEYEDRVRAVWTAQILAVILAMDFEHKAAAVAPVEEMPLKWRGRPLLHAPVDDDWYYEMVAVRAFERHGIGLTVRQLGEQWLENRCGSWGSSEQARLNLERGIPAPDSGHPRHNKLWFTIGPQFSSEVYGALAPGRPNLAGRLARELGHINGYAEGTDGAVFNAALVSLAFTGRETPALVREAARILDPGSPYRQAVDQVIALAEAGKGFDEVTAAVEDRWHLEYPATNNAVANGGLVAAAVWFGGGDFQRTLNLAARAADFSDADCNAANAAAVVGARGGMRALPAAAVEALRDRIAGTSMGSVRELRPPVDESISGLARRTAAIGELFLASEGARRADETWRIPTETVRPQPLERFTLSDLARLWNPDWALERAGFGGAGGGMAGIRGITHLEGDILATYPRDEVRACLLRRTARLGDSPRLSFDAGSEPGRAWELSVLADNTVLHREVIASNSAAREWKRIEVPLTAFASREVTLRLYQRVFVPNRTAGNALWRNLRLE